MSNRLPYEVIAGLDFGTTFTKCIVRNLVNEAECFPVPFELKGGRGEYFVPSLIIRSQGRVGTPLDTEMRGDGYVHFLKMRLHGRASCVPRQHSWNHLSRYLKSGQITSRYHAIFTVLASRLV